jgi:hypothetical protein
MKGMRFSDGNAYSRALARGARAAVEDVLAVKKDERVLLIGNPNPDIREISMALFDALVDAGVSPAMIFQRPKTQFDFAEEEVIKAIASMPDIVISISWDRLGKDRYGLRHGYKGKRRYDHIFELLQEEKHIRGFWSPGVTKDMFSRTVPIDYSRLRADSRRLSKVMSGAREVRVTAPGGTDITVGTKGRKPKEDDGNFTRPGRAGNVPSGEVYVSPELGTASGLIVFDGSIVLNEGEVVIKRPIETTVKDGFIVSIEGGREASMLKDSVMEGERKARTMAKRGELKRSLANDYAKNAWAIGELGIGLNRKARITANMLEDEKVYGTCHFAIGSNYDGDADAMIHLDGLVRRPTISVVSSQGRQTGIMIDGRLAWD